MERQDELLKLFAGSVRQVLGRCSLDPEKLQEIRLRANQPLMIVQGNREYFVTAGGALRPAGAKGVSDGTGGFGQAYRVRPGEIRETVECMGNYSLYAFEEEIRQGFLTVPGGHRIGLAGKTVPDGRGIRTMRDISFVNVRMAHQVKGCADPVMPYLYENGQALHTLIISPPRCGKTTLLRDIVRQLSGGPDLKEVTIRPTLEGAITRPALAEAGLAVGVVDERSELAACYNGVPQNDLGPRTDVLDCCPKAKGMMMLVRSMSPQVIAVDELGGREDLEAAAYVMNCGCRLIATVHGSSLEDVSRKPVLGELVRNRMFQRYILLGNRGQAGAVEAVLDESGAALYRAGEPETGNITAGQERKVPAERRRACG